MCVVRGGVTHSIYMGLGSQVTLVAQNLEMVSEVRIDRSSRNKQVEWSRSVG